MVFDTLIVGQTPVRFERKETVVAGFLKHSFHCLRIRLAVVGEIQLNDRKLLRIQPQEIVFLGTRRVERTNPIRVRIPACTNEHVFHRTIVEDTL